MPTIKRKNQSGFSASERKQSSGTEDERPDFSALEPDSGFTSGEVGSSFDSIEEALSPEPAETEPSGGGILESIEEALGPSQVEAEQPSGGGILEQIEDALGGSLLPSQSSADEAPKKRGPFSPPEVVRQKGCIGCGGMALALTLLLVLVVLAIALF